jgi:Rab GDP dissociation inhibitor
MESFSPELQEIVLLSNWYGQWISQVYKVPATDVEALKSPLMGLFEKRRARKFFIYVQNYEEDDPRTHEGMDLNRVTTKELFAKYGVDENTIDFIGHSLALHRDDYYLGEPALETVKKVKLYAESMARFQGGSPYIYPLYGLGELPQVFWTCILSVFKVLYEPFPAS